MTTRRNPDQDARTTDAGQEPDGGQLDGGHGRIGAAAGRDDAYPASDPYPGGENEVRTPGWFVQGPADDRERDDERGPEVTTSLGNESQPGDGTSGPGQPS